MKTDPPAERKVRRRLRPFYAKQDISLFGALAILRANGYRVGSAKDFKRLTSVPYRPGFARTYTPVGVLNWADTITANARYVRVVNEHGYAPFA